MAEISEKEKTVFLNPYDTDGQVCGFSDPSVPHILVSGKL